MKAGDKLVNITVTLTKTGWNWTFSEVMVVKEMVDKLGLPLGRLKILRLSGDKAGTTYLMNPNRIGVISQSCGKDNYYEAGQKVICGKTDVLAYKILLADRVQKDIRHRLEALKELPYMLVSWRNKDDEPKLLF